MALKTQTKLISIHAPKAQKPQTADQFGYFLAGLIDGSGNIEKSTCISITFAKKHVNVAYYIKGRIGYGRVKEVKHNNVYVYSVTKQHGVLIVANLIHHKLRCAHKVNAFNNILIAVIGNATKQPVGPVSTKDHWLAGFVQGQGLFQINTTVLDFKQDSEHLPLLAVCRSGSEGGNHCPRKVKDSEQRSLFLLSPLLLQSDRGRGGHGPSGRSIHATLPNGSFGVCTLIQIDQKTSLLLDQIKSTFAGYIGYDKVKQNYVYSSGHDCSNAVKWFKYLDRYQVMGGCLTCYWLWRKAYLRVQNKAYETSQGLKQIERFKKSLAVAQQPIPGKKNTKI